MIYIILLLTLVLRLIAINQSLWLDEAISALAAKNYTFTELISKFSLGDTHPPLYYLALRAWTQIFGFSEVSLRFPSIIFGVATVYVVYKIGKVLGGKKLAFLASLFMATAPLHIYYSQEARMYSLSTLAVATSVYLFLKKNWPLFSLSILLVGLTDYLPLLILPALWLFILTKRNYQFLRKFIKSHVPLLIFFVIWFPIFMKQVISTGAYLSNNLWWRQVLGQASLKELVLVWVKFTIGRISFENTIFYALIIFLSSLVLVVPLYIAFVRRRKFLLIWLWFTVPLAISFVGSLFVPGFTYFRLLFLLPAFYLVISYGVSKMAWQKLWIGVIVFMNILFSLIYLTNRNFWREDWMGLVSFIEAKIKTDEVVVISYPQVFAGYRWYSEKPEKVKSFKEEGLEGKKALYSLDYLMDLTDPERKNYQKLREEGFKDIEVYNFRGVGQVRYWRKI